MKFFRIAKWETYQHYNKPRPRWVKLYTSINDLGTDWRQLSDAELGQLVRLVAFAALNDNALPLNSELLSEMVGFDTDLDLGKLSQLGIITVFKDRSSCLSIKNSIKNPTVPSSEVRVQSSEDISETKIKSGKPDTVAAKNALIKEQAKEVLAHLNRTIGKNLTMTKDIEACFRREKCSVADCIKVIDYKWNEWVGTDMQRNVNHTTLFRASKFQAYLDMAKSGPLTARQSAAVPRDENGKPIPEWKQKMMKDFEAEDKNGIQ